jgi:MFS family permease
MLVGSLLAGMLMDWYQLRLAFTSGAVIMIAGVILFGICAYPATAERHVPVEQELE